MDTTSLERAYRQLLDCARPGRFRPPADAAAWTAEQHLACVVATDRLLSAVTAQVLAGGDARYDNGVAQLPVHLEGIGRAAGGHDQLVATVRQCGLELVLLARQLDESQAAAPVPSRIVEGAAVRAEAPLPWSAVLRTHAEVDLPARVDALARLR